MAKRAKVHDKGWVTCSQCRGTGTGNGTTCKVCKGKGKIYR